MNVHFHEAPLADFHLYHDDRTESILEGAKRAFAEKGFDGASMQDIARAAGMSAGNFYRYFPSKNAIVEAMIARDLASVKADFQRIDAAADPTRALIEAFAQRIDTLDCTDGPLWSEIDAAAVRRPEIALTVAAMEHEICMFLTAVFAKIAGITLERSRELHSARAAYLIVLFKGAAQLFSRKCSSIPIETRAELRDLVLASMSQTLAEIATTPKDNKERNE